MLKFFLKYILKKGLAIQVAWGLSYPTLLGDLVLNDVRLGKPAVVSAEKAGLNLSWGSIWSDVLQVERAEISGITATINLEDPLAIIRCLQGAECVGHPRLRQPGAGGGSPKAPKEESANSKLKPLKIFIKEFEAQGGEIKILREENGVLVNIGRASGRDIKLPLEGESLKIRLEFSVTAFSGSDKTAYSIQAELSWDGQTESLHADVHVKDFPLEFFNLLFPPPAAGLAGDSSEGKIATTLGALGSGETSGRLTGTLPFSYNSRNAPQNRWALELPFAG